MGSFLIDRFKGQNFTRGQAQIARYMLEHEYDLCRMSLMDVSEAVGVSDASVLRFVRCLGFSGFNDFKAQLFEKMTADAEQSVLGESPLLRDRVNGADRGEELFQVQTAAAEAAQSVERSLLQNTPAAYEELAGLIRSARLVYVCGVRGTKAVAEQFTRCLRFLKGNVICLDSSHDIQAALSGASEEDVLLFFCASRFYEADVHICQAAKDAGVPCCLITNRVPSPLTEYARLVLLAQTVKGTYFNSMTGMLSIAEYLLTLLSREQGETLGERLDRFDRHTAEERCQ